MTTQYKSEIAEGDSAVMYLRVSSKEQAEKGGEAEGYSIPAQREACKRKATSMGAVVLEEFIDRGESAKTADRPELQRLLAFVAEHPIKYLVVHKVDRLARNRADDVAINMALKQAGVTLVSVSENIDETPSGLLLHGIMSSIAEFYSRNLATEVIKGSLQKAKNGGTPGRAPIGYLNIRRVDDGRESRIVMMDEERGPLMSWAFETYATGEWTIRDLLAELTRRGLTTVPGPKTPARPLGLSHFHKLLRHPYYMGLVRYRGALYPGKHPRLVSPETWQRVQELLSAKNLAGEKQREHPHYLKGSIYCGRCQNRLLVSFAKGRHGGIYPYFICSGRQRDKTSCIQRAIRIDDVEGAIEAYYATVRLPEKEVTVLRTFLGDELSKLRAEADREKAAQTRRLSRLQAERKKLLDAHLADAVPLDLLKSEQERITTAIADIEGHLTEISGDFKKAETNLDRALSLVGECEAAYRSATDTVRRRFNLAFFERLLIDDDYNVTGELAEPFDVLLNVDIQFAAAIRAEEVARAVEVARGPQAVEDGHKEKHPQEPELASVGAGSSPATSLGRGLSQETLVHPRGPASHADHDRRWSARSTSR